MGQVTRPYSIIRELLGLDERLRHAGVLTGGRRFGPLEGWHYLGAAGEPSLNSPWSNVGSGYHSARFFRDERNTVHLSGLLMTSTDPTGSETIFTLPTGLRPLSVVRSFGGSSGPAGFNGTPILVQTSGAVQVPVGWWSADVPYLSLENVHFALGL